MDRGRMIDLKQNTNAVLIDRYEQSGRRIVKHINPPGGKSSFSLGWGNDNDKNNNYYYLNYYYNYFDYNCYYYLNYHYNYFDCNYHLNYYYFD